MTMKVEFKEVVSLAKQAETRGAKLWNAFAAFAVGVSADHEIVKAVLKEQETQTKEESKVNLQSIGAYRSAKSVILSALKNGVSLVDDEDNVRGKTEVEKELRALKTPEAPIATIQRNVEQAVKKIADIATKEDAMLAFQLAEALRSKAQEKAEEFIEHRKAA